MKKYILISMLLVGFALLHSCKKPIVNPNENHFGETITPDGALSFDELHTQLVANGEIENAKFKGKVESVCKVKGCWMNLAPTTAGEKEIFVKFKDYGFFMPLDCEGREVILEGRAYKEVTSVDELRHYAEDEGLPQEEIDAITEPKEELKFMAHGVIMLDEKG